MLLYLTSNLNLGLFDFIQDEAIPIKKLSGEFNLKKFVIRDMRSFSHIRFIAIDHQALNDSEEEIVEGVLGFRAMYDARIIYLAEGMNPGEKLLEELFEADVRNFITAVDPEEIRKEILECISPEGMSYEKAERFKRQIVEEPKAKVKRKKIINENMGKQFPEEHIEVNNTIKLGLDIENKKGTIVGVAGIDGKTGTTTSALNLACFLSRIGAKVSYIECNLNKQLSWLTFYDVAEDNGSINYMGVDFHTMKAGISLTEYDFNILDLGKIFDSGRSMNAFKMSDIRIMTATSKPYELKPLDDIGDESLNLIFSFTSDNDRQVIRKLINPHSKHQIYYSAYSPDLFNPMPNRMIWTNIMKDYLVAIPPEEQKKKRLRVS